MIVQGNPGKLEINASRKSLSVKASLIVEAPEVVEWGQSVTATAVADTVWDLVLELKTRIFSSIFLLFEVE